MRRKSKVEFWKSLLEEQGSQGTAEGGWDGDICPLIQPGAAGTGHCHPPLKEIPKCFVRSSTSAVLVFWGKFLKNTIKKNPKFNFHP